MKAKMAIEGIIAWISVTPIGELEDLAKSNTPIRDRVLSQYPLQLKPIADMLIGKKGLQELRSFTDNDCSIVIDEALRRYPAKGLILWKYKDWTIKNVRDAIAEFLAL